MQTHLPMHPARVTRLRQITPSVSELLLSPSAGLQPYAAGSHLQVRIGVAGQARTRHYSLVGQPNSEGYRIAVKYLEQGRGGSRAMWQLQEGDCLDISAPQNHFALSWGSQPYLLIAAGIGVTPLLSMAQALAARGAQVAMHYGVRSEEELAYAQELRAALGSRLALHVGQRMSWAQILPTYPSNTQVYVCGPLALLQELRQAWAQAGRDPSLLRFETFGSSARLATSAFRVQVPRHGLDMQVDSHSSLLEALEAQGVAALSDCRRGECGLCAMDVLALDGEIDHRDVFFSPHERASNQRICVCVSRVRGSITLDSAYRPDCIAPQAALTVSEVTP
jgi:ferredoxin-NADP reductase